MRLVYTLIGFLLLLAVGPVAAQADYDCVKIHGDLSVETLVALGEAARSAGLPLIGHVPRKLELLEVLATGAMQEISHAEEFLYTHFANRPREAWDEAIDEAARATKASGVNVVPTLVTYRSIAAQVRDLLDLEKNISHGRVTSAMELDEVLLGKIQAKLEEITGHKVRNI